MDAKISQPRPWLQEVVQLVEERGLKLRPVARWRQIKVHAAYQPSAGFWKKREEVVSDMEWLCEQINAALPEGQIFDPLYGITVIT